MRGRKRERDLHTIMHHITAGRKRPSDYFVIRQLVDIAETCGRHCPLKLLVAEIPP